MGFFPAGFGNVDASVYPSENNVVIELNEDESIRQIGKNVQIVVPGTKAAGYKDSDVEIELDNVAGTGDIEVEILTPDALKIGHQYKVKFDVLETVFLNPSNKRPECEMKYANTGYTIYDQTENDKVVYTENYKTPDANKNYTEDKKKKYQQWAISSSVSPQVLLIT